MSINILSPELVKLAAQLYAARFMCEENFLVATSTTSEQRIAANAAAQLLGLTQGIRHGAYTLTPLPVILREAMRNARLASQLHAGGFRIGDLSHQLVAECHTKKASLRAMSAAIMAEVFVEHNPFDPKQSVVIRSTHQPLYQAMEVLCNTPQPAPAATALSTT